MKFLACGVERLPVESLPPRGAWIEIPFFWHGFDSRRSLPPRGAWIEISIPPNKIVKGVVAPPTGSVD